MALNRSFVNSLLKLAEEMFSTSNVNVRELDGPPEAVELEIKTPSSVSDVVKIGFYDTITMLIGTFHFEFFDYSESTKSEILKLLKAAQEDKLAIDERKILGITITRKLKVKN